VTTVCFSTRSLPFSHHLLDKRVQINQTRPRNSLHTFVFNFQLNLPIKSPSGPILTFIWNMTPTVLSARPDLSRPNSSCNNFPKIKKKIFVIDLSMCNPRPMSGKLVQPCALGFFFLTFLVRFIIHMSIKSEFFHSFSAVFTPFTRATGANQPDDLVQPFARITFSFHHFFYVFFFFFKFESLLKSDTGFQQHMMVVHGSTW